VSGYQPVPTDCDNMNHRRSNAPVGYCPQCGGRVNASAPAPVCTETLHAAARRQRDAWCVHCGLALQAAPPRPRRM